MHTILHIFYPSKTTFTQPLVAQLHIFAPLTMCIAINLLNGICRHIVKIKIKVTSTNISPQKVVFSRPSIFSKCSNHKIMRRL